MKLRIEIGEAQVIPFGYGRAYYDPMRNSGIFFPVPLNWLVRWAREFYYFLARPKASELEKRLIRARYADSLNDREASYHCGYEQALLDVSAATDGKGVAPPTLVAHNRYMQAQGKRP